MRTSYRATVVKTTDPAELEAGWAWTVIAEYPGGEVYRWTWRTKVAAEAYAQDMRRRHGHHPMSGEPGVIPC